MRLAALQAHCVLPAIEPQVSLTASPSLRGPRPLRWNSIVARDIDCEIGARCGGEMIVASAQGRSPDDADIVIALLLGNTWPPIASPASVLRWLIVN
jgi:hypothetical protein